MSHTGYYWDAASLEHDTGHHVECIARAQVLAPDALRPLVPGLNHRPTLAHDARAWITRVHTAAYHDRVRHDIEHGRHLLDSGDTVACMMSYDAAIHAVNTLLTAADDVMSGAVRNAFCAVRPPGHHARPEAAMGFCIFANVAIAARYLQQQHGIDRIAVVDWDVHHGNGTQEIFYDDPSVLFVSLHQHPLWPGTGMTNEGGAGAGTGFTLNIPIAPGTSEHDYLAAFERVALPAVQDFQPEFVLISAGFDAHRDDPLGGLRLAETGFETMTRHLMHVADEFCDGRIVSALEGGYNLTALQSSVAAHVRELAVGTA